MDWKRSVAECTGTSLNPNMIRADFYGDTWNFARQLIDFAFDILTAGVA